MNCTSLGTSISEVSQPLVTSHPPTIVCIDDDPEVTLAIEIALSNYHVQVLRDFYGQQGLWDAVCRKPHLVITDLRMPHGDGEQVLQCLKSNRNTMNIPVIVVSGQPGEDLGCRMRSLGAAAFLRKPVPVMSLVEEIRKYVPLQELDWASVGPSGVAVKP